MSRDRYRSTLKRLGHYFSPRAFLHWWGQGLLLCLPPAWRDRLTAPPARLIVEQADGEIVISVVEKGIAQELVRYPEALLADGLPDAPKPQHRQVVLRLAPGQALAQTISLPQAAEANLRQVVGFELDRLTPFPADKIYYDARIVERHEATRSLRVRFVMVLRSILDPLLVQLRNTGLMPEQVALSGDDSGCNLLPVEQRPRRTSIAGRIQTVLLVLLMVTTLAALAVPLWQQRSLVIDLIPRVDAAQQRAEEAVALRRQLEDAVAASRFLLEKRQSNPRAIEIVNELTALLPDNTWVEQLEIRNNQVELRGQSAEATALLALVEESDLFEGATFRSPITRDRRTGQDRFYLTAQVAADQSSTAGDGS